jgi:uncharacterized protein
MLKVVLDTNVLVSAVINDGKSRSLLLTLLQEHTVISSRQLFIELSEVLSRDKFGINDSQANRYLEILTNNCKIVKDNARFKVVSADPDDDLILNVAFTGKADFIVTGDRHLLDLKSFKYTKIVKISEILEILAH